MLEVLAHLVGAAAAVLDRGPEQQVLAHRHGGEYLAAFGDERTPAADDLLGRHAGDGLLPEPDLAAARPQQAGHRPEQGRLAGAVGADDRDDLALLDMERDVAQHHQAAVTRLEVPDGQHSSSPR